MLIATSMALCKDRCRETQIVPRIAAAGFDGLDFNVNDMLDRLDWLDERAAGAFVDELGAAAAAASLRWVQAHGPMFALFSEAPKDRLRRCQVGPCLAACGRLGVPWMVLHGGSLGGGFDRDHRRLCLQRNADFFRSLLDQCERHGVGLAIENGFDRGRSGGHALIRSFFAVPENLCDLIDELNHPLASICWDTGHAHLQGLDQRAAIAGLGGRLKCLHVADNDGAGDLHVLPYAAGNAGVDWTAVAEGLRQAGYGGHFTYEAHNSFRALPEHLLDETLAFSVKLARHIRELTIGN